MPWNYSSATNTTRWLNVWDINRFYPDFDPAHPTGLEITFKGYITEPCPAEVGLLAS